MLPGQVSKPVLVVCPVAVEIFRAVHSVQECLQLESLNHLRNPPIYSSTYYESAPGPAHEAVDLDVAGAIATADGVRIDGVDPVGRRRIGALDRGAVQRDCTTWKHCSGQTNTQINRPTNKDRQTK